MQIASIYKNLTQTFILIHRKLSILKTRKLEYATKSSVDTQVQKTFRVVFAIQNVCSKIYFNLI